MNDDHEDDLKEPAINLQTAITKARDVNLAASAHILSMAVSEVACVPVIAGIDDDRMQQPRRFRAQLLPQM